jgi:hypothetical protein
MDKSAMESHEFVPAPPKLVLKKKKRRIIRPTREVGAIFERPDTESMTFVQQLVAMGLTGRKTAISTQVFRDDVGQLARRHRDATMGISGKYLLHALDSGDIEKAAAEVFGIDTTQARVSIDPELTMIAIDEAFDRLSEASHQGARMIFATSRPASMLPLMIELAKLARETGAQVLDSFDNSGKFIADGRKDRHLTWCSSVGVVTDGTSLLATNDANSGEDLLFHLPRPDIVIADHIFAGAALTSGYATIAFTGLESLAVAVASVPESQCLSVPISLSAPSSHYEVVAENARSYF